MQAIVTVVGPLSETRQKVVEILEAAGVTVAYSFSRKSDAVAFVYGSPGAAVSDHDRVVIDRANRLGVPVFNDSASLWFASLWMICSHSGVSIGPGMAARVALATFETSLIGLIDMHAQWAAATFPRQEAAGCLEHLEKEVAELADSPDDPEEVADVIFMALSFGRSRGMSPIDIMNGIYGKFDTLQHRKWPSPDEQDPGHAVRHIEG